MNLNSLVSLLLKESGGGRDELVCERTSRKWMDETGQSCWMMGAHS